MFGDHLTDPQKSLQSGNIVDHLWNNSGLKGSIVLCFNQGVERIRLFGFTSACESCFDCG